MVSPGCISSVACSAMVTSHLRSPPAHAGRVLHRQEPGEQAGEAVYPVGGVGLLQPRGDGGRHGAQRLRCHACPEGVFGWQLHSESLLWQLPDSPVPVWRRQASPRCWTCWPGGRPSASARGTSCSRACPPAGPSSGATQVCPGAVASSGATGAGGGCIPQGSYLLGRTLLSA